MKYDIPTIKQCFLTLDGWRSSAQEIVCFDELTDELKTSDSGVYYNDIPGIKLNDIQSMISPDEVNMNQYLADKIESSSVDLVNQFVQLQKEKLNTKAILSDLNIGVRQSTNIRNLMTKRDRFVGFMLKPANAEGVVATPTHLGVQFDTAQTITIYLYAQSQIDPIDSFEIETTKGNVSLEWFQLPDTWRLEHLSDTYAVGDVYYLGYYETDLTGQALETTMSCSSCSGSAYSKYSKYVSIQPIEVNQGNTYVSREIFDKDDVGYTTTTYGLHMRLNVDCDITKIICENKTLFASALQKRVAISIFWDTFNSDRLNRETLLSKEDARLNAEKQELDLEAELSTLSLDFSNLDAVCLPCRRNQIRRVTLL